MKTLIETSTLLWNILTLSIGKWLLTSSERSIEFKKIFSCQKFDILDIEDIRFHEGLLWNAIFIVHGAGFSKISGIQKASADELRDFVKNQTLKLLLPNQDSILSCWQMCDELLRSELYISTSKKESFALEWRQKFDEKFFSLLQKFERSSLLDRTDIQVISLIQKAQFILRLHLNLDECIQKRNEEFVGIELNVHRQTFDSVEKMPLTEEQRLAAVYFEDVNVLVASAGSGKTSSLVGKAIYAIKKKYYEPHEILMLAFANEAANGLKARFTEALDRQRDCKIAPDIGTFHSIGMGIIKTAEGGKPNLAPWAADEILYKSLLKDIMDEVCKDEAFKADMTLIVSTLMFGNATSFEQRAYYQNLFNSEDNDTMKVKAKIQQEDRTLKTLKGEMVRSIEELVIANWLSLNGVSYFYEKQMSFNQVTDGNSQRKEHKPDFYYPEGQVYHEHFALNKNGTAPSFMPDYLSRVEWKRGFYKDMQVKFFETHSSMFYDGSIFTVLKEQLKGFGLNPQPKVLESAKEEFVEGYSALMNLMATIIKHIRNQGRSSKTLHVVTHDPLGHAFHRLVLAVLTKYEDQLESKKVLDFEEMLIKASVYVENGVYNSPYKFICIDEFQDISQGRRRLVKALLDQKKGATLFAVGDDWQGIYRFAGADLDIFTRAAKYFGVTQELFLTNTFRSNQGIADVASWFVQKNPIQKKKLVQAYDKSCEGVLETLTYESEYDAFPVIEEQMDLLFSVLNEQGKSTKVFILSRYNNLLPHKLKMIEWERKYKKVLEISAMTFHRSKGLEADYVFILGMNSGKRGFPSIKDDHPLVQTYMSEAEIFPYAEERRLFYVALTRAKKKAFFVTRKGIPSIFLQEILELPNAKTYFRKSK